MAQPLIMLGPGGDYVTRFQVHGDEWRRDAGRAETVGEHASGGLMGRMAGVIGLIGVDRPSSVDRRRTRHAVGRPAQSSTSTIPLHALVRNPC